MWQSLNSWLSEAQQLKLTFDKGGKFSARQRIVRFWKGWCRARVANDKNIKKRSQHITVTA